MSRSFSYGLGILRRPSVRPTVRLETFLVIDSPPRPFVGFVWNLIRMFPSVSSCSCIKKNSGPSINVAAVSHLWFFLLLHLLRNYLTDSNETCLLCSPQCLIVQVQKKFRSVDKFGRLVPGSDLEWNVPLTGLLSHLLQDHWSDSFGSWSECSPQCLVVQVRKQKIRPVEKHSRRQPSLIFLVIASPQKLLGGFEWNLPVRLASISSCASTKPNSGRATNFTFLART